MTLFWIILVAGTILAIVMPFVVYYKRRNRAEALRRAQPVMEDVDVEVACPNCGATNKVPAALTGQCEYCKTVLQGPKMI